MFSCSGRKILLGVVTGTILSTAVTTVVTATDDETTHYLLDSNEQPVMAGQGGCVLTPDSPNVPSKLFKECGDIGDRDNDGIPDDEDVCPDNTPEEISKGVYQDGPRKGCSIDTDNDGVADYRDSCPTNTPREISKGVYDDAVPLGNMSNRAPEIAKDQVGCPLDTDHDCVGQYEDQCPHTEQLPDLCNKVETEGPRKGCLPGEEVSFGSDALFDFDSARLKSAGKNKLDEFIREYMSNVDQIASVEIVGHTDPIGTQQYNQRLSEKRAASVVRYMVANGISADKLSSRGVGESELVERYDGESNGEWRRRCRRVVVTINRY